MQTSLLMSVGLSDPRRRTTVSLLRVDSQAAAWGAGLSQGMTGSERSSSHSRRCRESILRLRGLHTQDNQAYSFLSLITYSDGRVQWNTVALLKFPFVVFAGEEL